jgi:hypothetical protein
MIIAKGEYPAELNIPLPFSLVNNNVYENQLEVMPAFYWLYNLYALERNSWKAKNRDRRKIKIQRIETDYLAPDTAEEIINALMLLNGWLGESGYSPQDMTSMDDSSVDTIQCRHFENSKRKQVISKPLKAIASYRQMLLYYAVKTISVFLDSQPDMNYRDLCTLLGDPTPQLRIKDWVNIGGQVVPAFRIDELRKDIGEGKYTNWNEVHNVYELWDEKYTLDKCRHAWAVMSFLRNAHSQSSSNEPPDITVFKKELTAAREVRSWIDKQIYESRAKDYKSSFKKATFRNKAEMEKVLGKPGENPFIRIAKKEGNNFNEMIERVNAKLDS